MWVSFWSPEITVVISCIIYFYKKVPADCSVAVSETLCMCVCVCAHTYACVRSHAGVHMFMCQVYGMRRFQGKVFLILPFHMNFISQYSFFFFLSNVGLSLLQDSFSPSCKSRGLQNPPWGLASGVLASAGGGVCFLVLVMRLGVQETSMKLFPL